MMPPIHDASERYRHTLPPKEDIAFRAPLLLSAFDRDGT
jgi:hypothetical protein